VSAYTVRFIQCDHRLCGVTGESHDSDEARSYRLVREALGERGWARVFGRMPDEPRFRWLDLCPEHADSQEVERA
jgi:hypothetical protein